jgi:outer membrane protein insertion porin family
MVWFKKRASLAWLLFFLSMLVASRVGAFEAFVVKDIKIVGLQRISSGTVFNYLPLKVGDILDQQRSAEVIKALFKTGFFQDVQLERDGDLLIIKVEERPAIASINISGNKEIDTDTLTKALKDVGLAENRVFDRSLLDKVEQELRRQYFSLGKYGVKITSTVTPQPRNRVAIAINIFEGQAARIRRINIIGNTAFTEDQLVDTFELSEPTVFSFFTDSDKYSQQKLRADLETMRSFYLDRGYINFTILSTQVTIGPEKKDIFITINIDEGEKFHIANIKLAGDLVVPRAELEKLITIKSGDVFSRKEVTVVTNAISERLGDDGYAFANINAIPEIDNKTKKVSLTLFVDPGKRVYVRRIEISGNTKTQDHVIRREMRQFEGAWFTPKKLNRSRTRIQRLGYFEQVNVETPQVPGTADQVDVKVGVTEGSTGSLQAGLGYGQPRGVIFNAKVTFNNFAGTGKRIALEANNDKINTIYSFSYTNPYYTRSGISRGFNVYYRQTNAGASNIADYDTDDKGASINYGFPLSEFDTSRLGFGYKNTHLKIGGSPPQLYTDWVADYGDTFDTITLNGSWSHDTRNRVFLADKGLLHQFSSEVALPGADLEYYKLSYSLESNWPLGKGFVLQLNGDFSYGDGYGKTGELPFFERFYAGGSRSVRGFQANSLGTRATFSNEANPADRQPLGGDIKMVTNLELIFPLPFTENSRAFRLGSFIDAGNVFAGQSDFNVEKLRASYGMSALWVTPVGVLSFSWGWPFNKQPTDKREVFQFYIGAPF